MTPARNKSAARAAEAVARAGPAARYAVNASSLRANCETALTAAARLRAYRDYLAQARAHKASGAGRPGDIDRQVLIEARQAAVNMRTLATSALRVVGSLSRGGELHQLITLWRDAVESAGTVSVADLWRQATAGTERREAIRSAGVNDALFAVVDKTASVLDAQVTARDGQLVVAGLINGDAVTASLRTAPRPLRAASVGDLFMRGRFDALSDALAQGEPAYLWGLPPMGNDVRAEDGALGAALVGCRECVRHVRKLEDTGLETYTGAEPGTVILIIAAVSLVCFVVGDVLRGIYCPPGDEEQSLDTGGTGCVIGKIIKMIGLLGSVLVFGWEAGKVTPYMTPTGSVLIRGTLTDFALTPAGYVSA